MTAGATEDPLGPLLNVLAQSLDVREVFNQISAVARRAVPHDRLMFGLITPDGEHYRVIASSENESQAALAEVPLSALSQRLLKEDFAIFHHVRTVPWKTWACAGQMRTASNSADQPFEWHPNLPWARGYESWMRLTVRLRGGVLGFLNVLSRSSERYTEADVPAARRIADLVALAFAHERLAEEERRRAEAQERAGRHSNGSSAGRDEVRVVPSSRRLFPGSVRTWCAIAQSSSTSGREAWRRISGRAAPPDSSSEWARMR